MWRSFKDVRIKKEEEEFMQKPIHGRKFQQVG
jgi:hypothetical protein